MTKNERVYAAVTGQKPDCLPYSFWTHFPTIDLDPVKQAEHTYQFYKTYDLDVVKTMNNGMYAIEDLGCKIDYSLISQGGVAKVISTPIEGPNDWRKIKRCNPETGTLARELYALELLLEKLKGEDVPVVFTVFSPLTTADKVSQKQVMSHIRAGYGEMVKEALEQIAESTALLAQRAIELGASGVFFASQMSNYNLLSAEIYREYGEPYDRIVLEKCSSGWMNVLHAHGDDILFEILKDYPVQVFNWHAWESLPTLKEAQLLTGKCLMGGLNRMDITQGRRNEVLNQIFQCYQALGGCNQILTPGCVIRYPLDEEMLHFVRRAKDTVEACMRK